MDKFAAIVGGGVIGGGWAARFLLNGWDVRIYDPDPQAERKLAAVLDNARRALPMLIDTQMPTEGKLTFCTTLDGHMRFRVSTAWGINSHQRNIGKRRSTPARIAIRWFLKVWMARSVIFIWCVSSGTICIFM